jgi:hypothetical protein
MGRQGIEIIGRDFAVLHNLNGQPGLTPTAEELIVLFMEDSGVEVLR